MICAEQNTIFKGVFVNRSFKEMKMLRCIGYVEIPLGRLYRLQELSLL